MLVTSRIHPLTLPLLIFGLISMFALPFLFTGQLFADPLFADQRSKVQLSAEEQAFLKEHSCIVIGIEKEWMPSAIVRKDGSIVGYDIDILNLVNQNTGANFTVHLDHWHTLIEEAQNRKIDGLGDIIPTEQRKQYFNFSLEYCRLLRMVIVLKGNPHDIKSWNDLKHRRIAIQTGNQLDEKTVQRVPTATIIWTDTAAEQINALIQGKADAIFGSGVYMYLAGKLGITTLQFAFAMDETLSVHYALRKDWPLALSIMNKGLGAIPKDEYNRIYTKWLGYISEEPFDYLRLMKFVLPVVLAVAICLILYFKKINRQLLSAQKALKKDILDRKRAQAELDWESRVNKAQAELGNALISVDQSIDDIASKVLSSAQALTLSEYGFVSEIDRDTLECRVYMLSSMFGESCNVPESNKIISFPRGKDGLYPGLWGHALNTGIPFYTNSPNTHPESKGLPQGHVPLDRFLSLPVKYGGTITGLIALANPPVDFNDRHIAAVQQLADLYALAIQRNHNQEDGKHIEDQLRQIQKMESLGTLAGGIAHDFNNILSVIIGHSELALLAVEKGKNNTTSIKQIIKASDRAKGLVEQILAFSRKMEPILRPIDLNQVINETEELLKRTFSRMISISADLCDDLWPINADAGNMTQVLINLCANAQDAMPDGGRLTIGTENIVLDTQAASHLAGMEPGNFVCLGVSDTGCGMDQKTMEHIFDPFFTSKEVGKGTGLGLSTVYGIVKSHGGHIICHSEPGLGTTFKIYLPAMAHQSESEKLTDTENENIQGNDETILLVDDEEQLRDIGKLQLERWGYRVITAASGEEALDLYQQHTEEINLVILDISMPGMGGHKALKELLKLNPGLKVIISSGYSLSGQLNDVQNNGAAGFIAKPFSAEEMLGKIKEVVNQP